LRDQFLYHQINLILDAQIYVSSTLWTSMILWPKQIYTNQFSCGSMIRIKQIWKLLHL